jgi:hypothetical protein
MMPKHPQGWLKPTLVCLSALTVSALAHWLLLNAALNSRYGFGLLLAIVLTELLWLIYHIRQGKWFVASVPLLGFGVAVLMLLRMLILEEATP